MSAYRRRTSYAACKNHHFGIDILELLCYNTPLKIIGERSEWGDTASKAAAQGIEQSTEIPLIRHHTP